MYITTSFAVFWTTIVFVAGFFVACILYAGAEKKPKEGGMWLVRDDDPQENQFTDNKPHWKIVEQLEKKVTNP